MAHHNTTTDERNAAVIDLRRKFDLRVERDPARGEVYMARDMVTYDPDPESARCIIGYGRSATEARMDLLEQLAELAVREGAAS